MILKDLKHSRQYASRALGGLVLLLVNEVDALAGHWAEARERVAVARQARGLGELVRNQVDLVPETRARLALDWRRRREYLAGYWSDLRGRTPIAS